MLDLTTPRDDRHIDIEDYLAALPPPLPAPREAIGANGAPPLDESPFRTLELIGRAAHGDHWLGKLAPFLGEGDRTLRRWRDGDGVPSPQAVASAREYARHTAQLLLAAAGEDELSEAVARRRSDQRRADAERGKAALAAALPRIEAAVAAKEAAKAAAAQAAQSPEEN
ncbi:MULTISPECIES: hypothetical protein [Methylobacteriaceae]|uniref:hypothetical protein n=1 Tax=Methylobacteriaceae TaxID=119045 RepID=UPI001171588E|nr:MULTISPECIES: hypothetical protein [Methylobacteriaceae]GEL42909.1 hypothetical protein MEX01_35000 [Methylorubrum extorquens]